jgi:hypothetical protein
VEAAAFEGSWWPDTLREKERKGRRERGLGRAAARAAALREEPWRTRKRSARGEFFFFWLEGSGWRIRMLRIY